MRSRSNGFGVWLMVKAVASVVLAAIYATRLHGEGVSFLWCVVEIVGVLVLLLLAIPVGRLVTATINWAWLAAFLTVVWLLTGGPIWAVVALWKRLRK
jgi:hypothetical protein